MPSCEDRLVRTPELTGRPRTVTIWAGRLFMLTATLHLAVFLGGALELLPEWVPGRVLWTSVSPSGSVPAATAAFWQSVGSFAVPTLLLGSLIAGFAKQGRALPAHVTWTLAGWSSVCAALVLPSGLPALLVASAMLVVAGRRRRPVG